MAMKQKIIFFGTPVIAAHTLQKLNSKFDIVLIITEPDKPSGRGLKTEPTPVKKLAKKLNLKIAQPKNKQEITNILKKKNANLGVIIAYGQILPQEAIKSVSGGILNIHGSILPKYRGSSPIQQAILNGDKTTGVTIMKINEGVDTGDILATKKVKIAFNDTTATLAQKLVEVGTKLLIEVIPKYLDGQIKLKAQPKKGSLAPKITKDMGQINWSDSAEKIDRQIRAFQPWPKSFTTYNNKRLIIHQAKIVNKQLIPQIVQIANKKSTSWQDFLNGQHLTQDQALSEILRQNT